MVWRAESGGQAVLSNRSVARVRLRYVGWQALAIRPTPSSSVGSCAHNGLSTFVPGSSCALHPGLCSDFGAPVPSRAAEESREAWNKSARLGILSEGYKVFLRDLSTQIKGIRDGPGKEQGGIQFVNLSPAWRDQNVYSYFNNSGEMPRERAGGLTGTWSWAVMGGRRA